MQKTTIQPKTAKSNLSADFLNSPAINIQHTFTYAEFIDLLEANDIDTSLILESHLINLAQKFSDNPLSLNCHQLQLRNSSTDQKHQKYETLKLKYKESILSYRAEIMKMCLNDFIADLDVVYYQKDKDLLINPDNDLYYVNFISGFLKL